jgi:aspartate/methionine/tyrosine aminotransferase
VEIPERLSKISSFLVMDVLEKAKEMEKRGIDIIHLEVGEPDFDTPQVVKKALKKALDDGFTHYTHSLGDLELRVVICENFLVNYGVSINPDQIVVTSGTSPGIFLCLLALLEADDEVILSDPGYACYPNFVRIAGGNPVNIPVYEHDGFQFRPEIIKKKISARTKAIFINSPMNPTGNLLSENRLKEIASLSTYIISDEIYHGLVYKDRAHSILEFTDKAFVLNGFSKLYAMTGLRIGYLIAPEKFIRPIQRIQQNLFISANAAVQRAAITALKEANEDIKEMKNIYNERRVYIVDRLRKLGFGLSVEPTGAFYVFVNASHLSGDSYHLAFDILEKAHVGVTPGIDFGSNGEGYLRFSYANSMENIKNGLNRIEDYLSRYNK